MAIRTRWPPWGIWRLKAAKAYLGWQDCAPGKGPVRCPSHQSPGPKFHRCPHKQLISLCPEHAGGGEAICLRRTQADCHPRKPPEQSRVLSPHSRHREIEQKGDMGGCSQATVTQTGSRAQSSPCSPCTHPWLQSLPPVGYCLLPMSHLGCVGGFSATARVSEQKG